MVPAVTEVAVIIQGYGGAEKERMVQVLQIMPLLVTTALHMSALKDAVLLIHQSRNHQRHLSNPA